MWTSQSETDIVKSEFQLCYFEDTEVVIKMTIKGRSPTVRRVSRTHRSALDWLFDRINLEPEMQKTYVDTKNQLADMLTKGSLMRDERNHLLRLFNKRSFSIFSCSHFRNFSFWSDRKAERHVKEVKKRLPVKVLWWRNQNQWIQRRQDSSTWCCAVHGARGKILRRIGRARVDAAEGQGRQNGTRKLGSEVESSQVRRQEKAQNSNLWKQYEREASSYSTKKRKFVRTATPKCRVPKYEVQKPSIHHEVLPCLGSWELQQETQHVQWKH